MPTYEYSCDNCQGYFEYFQGMSEPPKTVCEKCGGGLRRWVGAGSGLVFKGSGFYITDYKPAPAGGGSAEATGGSSTPAAAGGESVKKGDSGTPASQAASAPAPSAPSPSPAKD